MEKLNPMFSFQNSAFSVTPDKEGTGRVVVWREFGIVNSFTLESSFYAYRVINEEHVSTLQVAKTFSLPLLTESRDKELQGARLPQDRREPLPGALRSRENSEGQEDQPTAQEAHQPLHAVFCSQLAPLQPLALRSGELQTALRPSEFK